MLVFEGGEREMLGYTKFRTGIAVLALGFAGFAGAEVQNTGEPDAAVRARINAVAQLMAGLPNKAHAFTQTAAWKEHSDYMRTSWVRLYARQVAAMTTWRDAKLGQACPASGTLMYPFSGPDLLNAHWLFPACETIVMFGLEHI